MTPYTVFNLDSGFIKRSGGCPNAADAALQPQLGEGVIVGQAARGDTHYVAEGVVIARPAIPLPETLELSVGVDQSYALPPGVVVKAFGSTTTLEGGQLVLSAEFAGRYEMQFVLWPYRDHTMTVTVT
jgi:hypothetical protein